MQRAPRGGRRAGAAARPSAGRTPDGARPKRAESRHGARHRGGPGPTAGTDPPVAPCAGSTSTGQSATPCRSTRPHTPPAVGPRRPPSPRSAVELRLCEKTRRPSARSHSHASVHALRAPALSSAGARRSSGRRARPHRARPTALTSAAFRPCSPACPRSTRSRPTETGARLRARGPSERPALVPRGNIDSVVPWAASSQEISPPTNPVRFKTPPDVATRSGQETQQYRRP